jgi:hypothetical protein
MERQALNMMVDAIPSPGSNKREGIIDLAGPT